MADTYANYAQLAAAHQIGVDYQLLSRSPAGSRLAHIAIHGGGIEPGTTELADYLASSSHLYYSFDAMMPTGNSVLHITSTNYDEPIGLALVATADYVISWHGAADNSLDQPLTYIGGLDTATGSLIAAALSGAGFLVEQSATYDPELNGSSPSNITNRSARGMGVQMELSYGLRSSFFLNGDTSRANRVNTTPTFYAYVQAVLSALTGLDVPLSALNTSSMAAPVALPPSRVPTGMPGDLGVPLLAPLYADGMPLDALADAVRVQGGATNAATRTQRFWSTPPRNNADPTREVFDVSLASAQLVNQVQMQVARFPCRAWVQYQSPEGQWQPLCDPNGAPLTLTIADSLPAIIPAGVSGTSKLHPQHFGSGHWVQQQLACAPTTLSRMRVILVRQPSGSVPVATDGTPVAYSLGLRDVAVGYQVSTAADVPPLAPQDAELSVPLATDQDVLGSQVDYLIRSTPAWNLLTGAGVWRSAPQPVPNAVVNLYLDLRDSTGIGQTIDQVQLQAITSGCTVNLYSCDSTPQQSQFAPSDAPLTFPLARPMGDGATFDTGLLLGDPLSGLVIDNRALQFDGTQPWLLAMTVQPQIPSSSPTTLTLLDNGLLTVTLTAGVLQVTLGPRIIRLPLPSYSQNTTISFAASFDGSTLVLRNATITVVQPASQVAAQTPAAALYLGLPVSGAPGGLLRITSLMLAQGRPADIDTIDPYFTDPSAYITSPGYGTDASTATCANALLRLDPSWYGPTNSFGLVGGPGVDCTQLVWTPIPGSFTLRSGTLQFRPVHAQFLNLEITNLTATPIVPSQSAPLVSVNLFPGDTGQGSPVTVTAQQQPTNTAPAGVHVATNTTGPYAYSDTTSLSTAPNYINQAYTPTEALYAPDPLNAQQLRRSQTTFPYMPLPRSASGPRWATTGVHNYHAVDVQLDTKTAYSAAIASLQVLRSAPTATADTLRYVELFHDTQDLDGYDAGSPNGWIFAPGQLTSPPLVPMSGVSITSQTMASRSEVTAIQIATSQTDAWQLAADPNFLDSSLFAWEPVGDATLAPVSQYTDIGQMAQVSRGAEFSSWGSVMGLFPTWGAIASSSTLPGRPQWADLQASASAPASFGGIISVGGVNPAPSGRLFAAARIYTPTPLTQPLVLQLVNGDGTILAQAEAQGAANQVTEWFCGCQVQNVPGDQILTWGQLDGSATDTTVTWGQLNGQWSDIANDYRAPQVFDVQICLQQTGGPSQDVWLVDSLAIYNETITWEVSNNNGLTWWPLLDIRNNPHGAFTFPPPLPEDASGGTTLRWRATSYQAGDQIQAAVLRPWYAGSDTGGLSYDVLSSGGQPTLLADWLPPVEQDPFFQAWDEPIPQGWWLASRKWLANSAVTAPTPGVTVLPSEVVVGTNEGAPPIQPVNVLAEALVLVTPTTFETLPEALVIFPE